MSHSIVLNFEDGVTRFIDSVRTRPLPTPLTVSGSTSRSTVATACAAPANAASNPASTTRGSYLEDALTEEEAAAGLALACHTRPKTDLVTAIAWSSEACKTRGQTYRARLHSVERLSETTDCLLARCGGCGPLPARPVREPSGAGRRPATAALFLQLIAGRRDLELPGAEYSARGDEHLYYLREKAVPGTPVEFIGPAGSFYLREIKRPLLLLAGGTGLAPFLSMLGKIAETGSAYPIILGSGVTHDVDLVGVERSEEFGTKIPGFTFFTCVAAEESAHPRKGYVTAHVEASHLNGSDVDLYLCGPPPMVDAVRAWLGVTQANFYYEKFAPSGVLATINEAPK
jgi:benzoate/toluate 1,2-dioxygenase reductase subunit